jgi:peptidoglycan/LPS O-acetylase OafA/YrhL
MGVELGALGALAVSSLAYKFLLVGPVSGMSPRLQFALANALPRYLDVFALGMALAVANVWSLEHPLPRVARFIDAHSWIPWALAGVALWALATQIGLAPNSLAPVSGYKGIAVHYLDAVVALGLVLPAVIGHSRRGVVRRILGNRGLIWIGVVSYGFYLWHLAVLTQLWRWGVVGDVVRATGLSAMVVWTVMAIVPALALAAASWYWIEKPVLRFKDGTLRAWTRRVAST